MARYMHLSASSKRVAAAKKHAHILIESEVFVGTAAYRTYSGHFKEKFFRKNESDQTPAVMTTPHFPPGLSPPQYLPTPSGMSHLVTAAFEDRAHFVGDLINPLPVGPPYAVNFIRQEITVSPVTVSPATVSPVNVSPVNVLSSVVTSKEPIVNSSAVSINQKKVASYAPLSTYTPQSILTASTPTMSGTRGLASARDFDSMLAWFTANTPVLKKCPPVTSKSVPVIGTPSIENVIVKSFEDVSRQVVVADEVVSTKLEVIHEPTTSDTDVISQSISIIDEDLNKSLTVNSEIVSQSVTVVTQDDYEPTSVDALSQSIVSLRQDVQEPSFIDAGVVSQAVTTVHHHHHELNPVNTNLVSLTAVDNEDTEPIIVKVVSQLDTTIYNKDTELNPIDFILQSPTFADSENHEPSTFNAEITLHPITVINQESHEPTTTMMNVVDQKVVVEQDEPALTGFPTSTDETVDKPLAKQGVAEEVCYKKEEVAGPTEVIVACEVAVTGEAVASQPDIYEPITLDIDVVTQSFTVVDQDDVTEEEYYKNKEIIDESLSLTEVIVGRQVVAELVSEQDAYEPTAVETVVVSESVIGTDKEDVTEELYKEDEIMIDTPGPTKVIIDLQVVNAAIPELEDAIYTPTTVDTTLSQSIIVVNQEGHEDITVEKKDGTNEEKATPQSTSSNVDLAMDDRNDVSGGEFYKKAEGTVELSCHTKVVVAGEVVVLEHEEVIHESTTPDIKVASPYINVGAEEYTEKDGVEKKDVVSQEESTSKLVPSTLDLATNDLEAIIKETFYEKGVTAECPRPTKDTAPHQVIVFPDLEVTHAPSTSDTFTPLTTSTAYEDNADGVVIEKQYTINEGESIPNIMAINAARDTSPEHATEEVLPKERVTTELFTPTQAIIDLQATVASEAITEPEIAHLPTTTTINTVNSHPPITPVRKPKALAVARDAVSYIQKSTAVAPRKLTTKNTTEEVRIGGPSIFAEPPKSPEVINTPEANPANTLVDAAPLPQAPPTAPVRKAKALAVASDAVSYIQQSATTNVAMPRRLATGSGVFLVAKNQRIELPNRYLGCKDEECTPEYRTNNACQNSHHVSGLGSITITLNVCPTFVMYGFCYQMGTSCARGIHPCPNNSRFNVCHNRRICKYLHDITLDQYGQSLFAAKEPTIMAPVNDVTTLKSTINVTRVFDLETPGVGTDLGPRNDNDFRDFTRITVLPTMDEIIPGRQTVYMPYKEMMFPLTKVLDVAFRHEREAILGPVRDCVADTMRRIIQGDKFENSTSEAAGRAYGVYTDAWIGNASVSGGRNAKTSFAVSFASPGHEFLKKDTVLKSGHLLAVLTCSGKSFKVIWVTATMDWNDRDIRGRPSKIGKIEVTMTNKDLIDEDMKGLLEMQSSQEKFWLLDFSGVLPNAFMHGLTALQQMAHSQLPFAEGLFAHDLSESMSDVPQYLRNASIDLAPLGYTGVHKQMPERRADRGFLRSIKAQLAKENDKGMAFVGGQADAIINCLSSSLSCIQGPPGTGKSFTGKKIVKLLAEHRRSQLDNNTIPILLTAQTNHALDETLAGYISIGLRVARLGIPHGKELPEPEHIGYQSHVLPRHDAEIHRRAIGNALRHREEAAGVLDNLLGEKSKGSLSWFRVAPFLKQHHRGLFDLFNQTGGSGRPGSGFLFWLNNEDHDEDKLLFEGLKRAIPEVFGGRREASEDGKSAANLSGASSKSGRSLEDLAGEADPWKLSAFERKRLADSWKAALDPLLDREVVAARGVLDGWKEKFEAAVVAETAAKMISFGVDVVGCTTTRAARDQRLFEALRVEVVVVEEAGEIVEAMTLPCLLPSVQHVVAIGDHVQLKPFCDHRGLTGGRYNHDQSLFERLVSTSAEGAPSTVRLARLDCQRRMRPEIANLLRSLGLYQRLTDGDNVRRYPDVEGMGGCNVSWFDHRHAETLGADKSFLNGFEASMVAAHAAYLARSGDFGLRDIVIIAPYNGQVKAISAALEREGSFEAAIPAADMDLLIARSGEYRLPLEAEVAPLTLINVAMSHWVRVTTVDNFQGEEAEVILYSSTRSNRAGNVGFTDVSNRVCVTLSRARRGLFLYGNAETASSGGPMWRRAVGHLRGLGLVRHGIPVGSCGRHPGPSRVVTAVSGFRSGCGMPCGTKLSCGHACSRNCHDPELHCFPQAVCCQECVPAADDASVVSVSPLETDTVVDHLDEEEDGTVALATFEEWHAGFARVYSARSRSLAEGTANGVPNRQGVLSGFDLSRPGLRGNIFAVNARMSVFSGFGAEFREGMLEAERVGGRWGVPGLVERVQEVGAVVRRAIEEDFHWFQQELVGLATSSNSSLRLADAFRDAAEAVFRG